MYSYGGEGYRGICSQSAFDDMVIGHVNFNHYHYHALAGNTCAGVETFKHRMFWLGKYQLHTTHKAFVYYYEIDGSMGHAY